MTYKTLSYGSTGDDVKKLQTSLGIDADGHYGPQTQAAVRDYQQKNGLSVDGIAGEKTLTKLYGNNQAVKTQTAKAPDIPSYNPSYDNQLDELYQKIVGRDKFSYDASKDPLFSQYRDMYIAQGQQAMQDTIGQAAALTGGYGSSYAQAVGQQQYDAYLQKLGEVIPELYGVARNDYDAETNNLMQQYSMLNERANTDYNRRNNEYERLVSLISTTGYDPTDSELAAGGMTRAQANAYRSAYTQKIDKSSTGSKVDDKYNDKGQNENEPVVDENSVISLGYGPISGQQLAALVKSGEVEEYTEGNVIRFRKANKPLNVDGYMSMLGRLR